MPDQDSDKQTKKPNGKRQTQKGDIQVDRLLKQFGPISHEDHNDEDNGEKDQNNTCDPAWACVEQASNEPYLLVIV